MRAMTNARTLLLLIASLLIAVASVTAGEGGASLHMGYVYADYEGNSAVDHLLFNRYEGFAFSVEDVTYFFDNGVALRGNLTNLTMNNRNLRMSMAKPGRFNFSLSNNQYRQVYDSDGAVYTRRRSTGINWSVVPLAGYRVFGSYRKTAKQGRELDVYEPFDNLLVSNTDYTHQRYSFGGQASFSHGVIRLEYRHSDFESRIGSASERNADNIRLDVSSVIPGYDRIRLSGGYYYRLDRYTATEPDIELKTKQGWLGARALVSDNLTTDYRFLFARSTHTGTDLEADNVVNTISVSKSWARTAGLRVGYENRIADDLVDRTVSNGILFSGWYNHGTRLFLKGMVASRNKEIKTGATLVGDEDITRHRISARYATEQWGDVTLTWVGRIRKNPDIDSRADYNVLSATLNLEYRDYGHLSFTHSYYLGQFENHSDGVDYEFSDHISTVTLTPRKYRGITTRLEGTYYRSRRDADIEKFSLMFSAEYAIDNDYRFGVKYEVFNYDDFLTSGAYYTANIVEVNIARDFSLK